MATFTDKSFDTAVNIRTSKNYLNLKFKKQITDF